MTTDSTHGRGRCSVFSILQAAIIATAVMATLPARADIESVGGGPKTATPLGDAYSTIRRDTGFFGELYFKDVVSTPMILLRTQVEYQPFVVRNLSASINTITGYIGAEVRPDLASFPVVPFFSADVGGQNQWLKINGNTNSIASTWVGAFQLRPGIQVPFFQHLSAVAALPYVYTKLFTTWGVNLSLRWTL